MKLCGVHGEVDKRDKCREGEGEVIHTVRRPIASKGMVQLAPNTYGSPFVLRAFLSAPCQPINASFPVYGAFWRVYAVNVDPALYLSSASLYQVAGNISRRIRVLCPFVDPRKFWKSDPRETRQPYRSMWKCWRKNYGMCNLTNRIFFISRIQIPNFFYGTIQRGNTTE